MHPFITATVSALIATTCVGCGGAGGSSGTPPVPPSGMVVLGTRGVPGGSVTVSGPRAVAPGTENAFLLDLEPGMQPTQVTAWITAGAQPDGPGMAATLSPAGARSYDVRLYVPAPIPAGSHVRVSLVFADGAVIETGTDDFVLDGG